MHAPLSALRSLVCAALLSVTASAAAAQTADRTGAGATMQGKVRPIASEQYLLLGAHTALQKQVSETAHKLNAIVLRNPAFSPPMGLDIAPVVKARSPHVGVNRSAIKYEVAQLFYWYRIVQDGKVIPEHVHCCGFTIYANEIVAAFDSRELWVEDPDRATWWEPRQTSEEAGFPYYDTHVVVMKKNDRPIWIPVTKEEVIARKLANLQKAVAELPPEAEARVHKMAKDEVACLQAALAALPPAERGERAYISHAPTVNQPGGCSQLVDSKTPYARGLVRENPNFYDKSLPPTAIQVMVLVFRHIQYPPRIWHSKVVDKLRDEMDYAALAEMIAGK